MFSADNSYNLFSATLDHIIKCVSTIERIIGVYNDPENQLSLKGIGLKLINGRLVEESVTIDNNQNEKIRTLQKDCKSFLWLDKNNVPFETEYLTISQLNIFDELKHLILVISIPQIHTRDKALIFLYLKNDISHFGVHHTKEPFSTQNKAIIANLLWNSVNSFTEEFKRQHNLLSDFAKKSHEIITNQHNNNQRDKDNKLNGAFILSWASHYLAEFSEAHGINYVYSDETKELLEKYKGEFYPLQEAIKKAIEFTKLIVTYVTQDYITIEASYINWPNNKVTDVNTTESESILHMSHREEKVASFLTKLEVSATGIYNSDGNLTSLNVGQNMPKPISAAAISDFLSKNKDRVNQLFIKFPDKWTFIKNNFRPVINISEKKYATLKNWG